MRSPNSAISVEANHRCSIEMVHPFSSMIDDKRSRSARLVIDDAAQENPGSYHAPGFSGRTWILKLLLIALGLLATSGVVYAACIFC
jgi:hypothetical protein